MGKLIFVLAIFVLCLNSTKAQPVEVLSVEGISNNLAADVDIGEAQIFIDVEDYGSNRVLFKLRNIGPDECYIRRAYFFDGSLLQAASLIDADEGIGGLPTVDFTSNLSAGIPGDLLKATFLLDLIEAFESDIPSSLNSVYPGEWLGVLFDLQPSHTYDDVLLGLNSNEIMIGLTVQGFVTGGSEIFVAVPEPGTLLLLGLGGLLLRKRK